MNEYIAAEVLEIGCAADLILGAKDANGGDFTPDPDFHEQATMVDVDE